VQDIIAQKGAKIYWVKLLLRIVIFALQVPTAQKVLQPLHCAPLQLTILELVLLQVMSVYFARVVNIARDIIILNLQTTAMEDIIVSGEILIHLQPLG